MFQLLRLHAAAAGYRRSKPSSHGAACLPWRVSVTQQSTNRRVRAPIALLTCTIMRQLVFALVLGWGIAAFAQMAPVADRVAKQNALFEEYYQAFLKNFPERATA